jgi:hypothetical protein
MNLQDDWEMGEIPDDIEIYGPGPTEVDDDSLQKEQDKK